MWNSGFVKEIKSETPLIERSFLVCNKPQVEISTQDRIGSSIISLATTTTTTTTMTSSSSNPDDDSLVDFLVKGTLVQLDGLVSAKHLNGRKGVIAETGYDAEKGRYPIALVTNKPTTSTTTTTTTTSSKIIMVKPINLKPLCTKCQKLTTRNDSVSSSCCNRCKLPYCSKNCRDDHWNTQHKEHCVPVDLPYPPLEPVGASDVGDDLYEAHTHYLNMACQAGKEGRRAEEMTMLLRIVEADPTQAAALFNLFLRYKEQENYDEAFAYLSKAVNVLQSPHVTGPSSSESPPSSQFAMSAQELVEQIVWRGSEFIQNVRVPGRTQLKKEATVLKTMLILCQRIQHNEGLRNDTLSNVHNILGNVLRKMSRNDEAKEHLLLADTTLWRNGHHHVEALGLISEIVAYQAMYESKTLAEKQAKIQLAVDQARALLDIVMSDSHDDTYPPSDRVMAQELLAKMLFNQMNLFADHRTEDTFREIHRLAKSVSQASDEDCDPRTKQIVYSMLQHPEVAKYD